MKFTITRSRLENIACNAVNTAMVTSDKQAVKSEFNLFLLFVSSKVIYV